MQCVRLLFLWLVVCSGTVLFSITWLGPPSVVAPKPYAFGSTSDRTTFSQAASEPSLVLLRLINDSRFQAGVKALRWNEGLAQAAEEHARRMVEKSELSHQFYGERSLASRLALRIRFEGAGENVFYDRTVEHAHEVFMNSPQHRANILNAAYDCVGIGIVENARVLYIVEDFARCLQNFDNDRAARIVAQRFHKLHTSTNGDEFVEAEDGRLQQIACAMAESETVDATFISSLHQAVVTAAYATTDPDKIPASVARLAALHGVRWFAVKTCYRQNANYPSGVYWVAILLR